MTTFSTNANKSVSHPTRLAGVLKDYLLGLDSIRTDLEHKEEELSNILAGFYKVERGDANEEKYREYLLSISLCLDECNDVVIVNRTNRAVVIDGQIPIAKLVNLLKDSSINLNPNTLEMIIDFWENIKYSLEVSQILIDALERDVYSKLNVMYSCSSVTQTLEEIDQADDQMKVFISDITKFSKSLPEKIMKCRLLIKTCGTHLRPTLIDRSTSSDRILSGVTITKYPLLRIMPDLEFKMCEMFQICRKWLDREETFMLNINQQIRKRKILAKEKETRIISARDHQKNVMKSLKTSYILCQNSKIKMKEIVKELKTLESQILIVSNDHQQLSEEKYKTQSMAEFLSISISQTRKNYSLQMKKQRLEMQVTELETNLVQLDAEISMLKQEMVFKSQERMKTKDKLEVVEKTYLEAKNDLESYSQSLNSYKKELLSIRQSLKTMESLQILKSSPEYIENVFGETVESERELVHLAPSLLNAISKRHNK